MQSKNGLQTTRININKKPIDAISHTLFAISLLLSQPQVAEALEVQYVAEIPYIETTEQFIRREFSDIPIMIEIARCESNFTQSGKNGTLSGVINPKDKGAFQINEYYHLETSTRMGIDIHTLAGNAEYARYLYEQNGTRDWNASKHCWSK